MNALHTHLLQPVFLSAHEMPIRIFMLSNCDWLLSGSGFSRFGLIDLFDFDPKNNRQDSIVIQNNEKLKKEYWFRSLALLIEYAFMS
jgi:hypothetical protein